MAVPEQSITIWNKESMLTLFQQVKHMKDADEQLFKTFVEKIQSELIGNSTVKGMKNLREL
jgi:hypothetical protein